MMPQLLLHHQTTTENKEAGSDSKAGAETEDDDMADDALVTLLAKKSGIVDIKYNLKFNYMRPCLNFTLHALPCAPSSRNFVR